jgi:uridine kinase
VTVLPLDALADRVRAAAPSAGSTRVVAIDGPGGSGKSTLAQRLATVLAAPVLHMDDLYPGWHGLAAGAPLLHDQVLRPLAHGQPGRYRRYDWSLGAYAEWRSVPIVDVLVVEGCGSGSRIVMPYLAMLVWVEAARDVRFARGVERDGEASLPMWRDWAAQEDVVFAAERTRDRADLRIDGDPSVDHDPAREVVLLDRVVG